MYLKIVLHYKLPITKFALFSFEAFDIHVARCSVEKNVIVFTTFILDVGYIFTRGENLPDFKILAFLKSCNLSLIHI